MIRYTRGLLTPEETRKFNYMSARPKGHCSSPAAVMLAKVANALGIRWYLVGDDDGRRKKEERRLKGHLDGADPADRLVFPYPDIEVNLLRRGYEVAYHRHASPEIRAVLEKAVSLARGDSP